MQETKSEITRRAPSNATPNTATPNLDDSGADAVAGSLKALAESMIIGEQGNPAGITVADILEAGKAIDTLAEENAALKRANATLLRQVQFLAESLKALKKAHEQDASVTEALRNHQLTRKEDEVQRLKRTVQLVELDRDTYKDLTVTWIKKGQEINVDALTGLDNAALTREKLEYVTGRGDGSTHLLLDLIKFKKANDKFGHLRGNEILERIGEILKELVRRPNDSLARIVNDDIEGTGKFAGRLGGDEFLINLRGRMTPEDAGRYGTILINAIRNDKILHELTNGEFNISASVGVVICPAGSTMEPAQALQIADERMYLSKGHVHDTDENFPCIDVGGIPHAYKDDRLVPWSEIPKPKPVIETTSHRADVIHHAAPSLPPQRRGWIRQLTKVLHLSK